MKRRTDVQLVCANARAIREQNALRAEWEAMLADAKDLGCSQWTEAHRRSLRTLLAALDTPKATTPGFVMKLSAVGNPDHREFYGAGVLAPTFTVEAPTITTLVAIQQAYIAVYELGGGNLCSCDVYLRSVKVAEISYNGRVWNQYPFEDPRHRELDPNTGEEIAR